MLNKFKTTLVLIGKKQFLPADTDIKNVELKKLAKRLEGNSEKETLTNILEWQDRNVLGWVDRMYMFPILYILLITSFCLLPINSPIKEIVSLIFVVMCFVNLMVVLSYFLPLIGLIILLFSWLFSINPLQVQKTVSISSLILLSIMFGALTILLIFLLLKYRSIKSKIPDFKLEDTFKLSLSVSKILKYKLAVCRDYAKLTASLLFSIYPNSKVYFLTIPRYVAVAVKTKNDYYVLDQKLPVLTKNGWLNRWNRKNTDVYVSELILNSEGKPVGVDFKKHEKVSLFSEKVVNADELTKKVAEMLKIRQDSQKDNPYAEIPLKNFAIYYEDDEITKYSLIRAIKNKLESELCGNIDKVSKIEITQNENEKDVIIKVYFNSEPILRPSIAS